MVEKYFESKARDEKYIVFQRNFVLIRSSTSSTPSNIHLKSPQLNITFFQYFYVNVFTRFFQPPTNLVVSKTGGCNPNTEKYRKAASQLLKQYGVQFFGLIINAIC